MNDGEIEGGGWGAECEPRPTTEVEIKAKFGSMIRGRKIMAFVFGVWAVHRATSSDENPLPSPRSWSVSHLPTVLGLGVVYDLEFWDAIRIARALEDTGVYPDAEIPDAEDVHLIFSTVGALHDHYVWPMLGCG